jgi:hypothetical protein
MVVFMAAYMEDISNDAEYTMGIMVVAMPMPMIMLITMMPVLAMRVGVVMFFVVMLDTVSMFILMFMTVNSTHFIILLQSLI